MSRFRQGTMDHDGDGRMGGSLKGMDMTTKSTESAKANDAIEKLKAKDGEPNNESARTNEILAARAAPVDQDDAAKASIAANDPTLSRAAYTSDKSGFNEDLIAKEAEKADKEAAKK